jgi:Ni,Fe-hydrogenase maturation factor
MVEAGRERPPVAVVAMGDASHHDDALAVRVLGRVRTLIGEIGCRRRREQREATDANPGSLFEWIEGGSDAGRLEAVLGSRRRVVLIDAVRLAGKPGTVHHWHLECGPDAGLTGIRHYNGKPTLGMQHLALWLEDELPEHGTDFIGIQAFDFSDGEGLSAQVRRELSSICSQVAGIMVRILEEEGW